MSSYGLGKLKKSSKNGSKSGSKMEVRGKVGGGRWWWELEKVEIFRFFSVVAKCHEMMGNDVKRVWECVLGCGGVPIVTFSASGGCCGCVSGVV